MRYRTLCPIVVCEHARTHAHTRVYYYIMCMCVYSRRTKVVLLLLLPLLVETILSSYRV